MRGPTSPYGSLSSLWSASKAAYSSAIDAPYAYLVRRRGISKGVRGTSAAWSLTPTGGAYFLHRVRAGLSWGIVLRTTPEA
jgi:hypothetical protein